MGLFEIFVEQKTKFNLSYIQKKALQLISEQVALEQIYFFKKEETAKIPFWQLDYFETLYFQFSEMEKRKVKLISDIEHQEAENKQEVIDAIKLSTDLFEIEDLYRPFRRRKKTKASLAREAGLSELADWVMDVAHSKVEATQSLEVKAKDYIKPALGFVTYDIVLKGVQDLIVDKILKIPALRKELSQNYYSKGILTVSKTEKFKEGKYSSIANFKEKVSDLLDSKNYYKFPLVKKAWEEGLFKVLIELETSEIIKKLEDEVLALKQDSACATFLKGALKKAVDIHIVPSITQEIIEELLKISEQEVIKRLKQDYQRLLMTPAFGSKSVLTFIQTKEKEIDFALVTDQGELVSTSEIKLESPEAKENFLKIISDLSQIKLGAFAIGLNDYTRSVEQFLLNCFENDTSKLPVPIVIVDTRGLGVFVKKEVALDGSKSKTQYSLRSLARRLQDPLYELAKYNGKSLIDVPSYISSEALERELDKVLKFCIASVGADLNTSSAEVLNAVDGLSPELTEKIINHRNNKARFVEKVQLRTELNFSEEVYNQCSGFLKVAISKSLLDKTQISGKDFAALKDMLKEYGLVGHFEITKEVEDKIYESKWKTLLGEEKLKETIKELKKPYSDPRRSYKVFSFSDKLLKIEDLKVGWNYPGLVTRFSSFGVFVNIGLEQEGLVHLSELSGEYISDPRKAVGLGEWIYVKLIDFKPEKKLISLSKVQAKKKVEKKKSKLKAKPKKQEPKELPPRRHFERKVKDPKVSSASKSRKSSQQKVDKKQRKPFNNPFAALSDLNVKD